MSIITLQKIAMPDVPNVVEERSKNWLWHGYLFPGDIITLLTSQWKSGKTTLVSGLLQQLGSGGAFLGQPLRGGRALVVSEESHAQWTERLRQLPIGAHVHLLSRPFRSRPTVDEWKFLIDDARDMRARGELDLFVVDPLASFLPGRCESDANTLLEMLQPLHALAIEGVAVLLLHHPRKKKSEPGSAARGSGALLGFVDIILELSRLNHNQADRRRRQLIALSRKPETPPRLAYEWDAASGRFIELADLRTRQFEENWNLLRAVLAKRHQAVTHHELLGDWPADQDKPCAVLLYEWLNRAFDQKRLRRHGAGTKADPWRWRLENDDDKYFDRGELPPLKDLPIIR